MARSERLNKSDEDETYGIESQDFETTG
eukprot:COSAG02_NODE_51375_length_314_cov_0.990698_1_plen_27_part_10